MNETTRVILAVVFIVALVALFIGTYILNKRTPKPEGCEEVGAECEGCQITSCSNYRKKEENERKDENTL